MMEKKIFAVSGMKCVHCKARVEEALKALSGVAAAEGDLARQTVAVTYDAAQASPEEMAAAVAASGPYVLTL